MILGKGYKMETIKNLILLIMMVIAIFLGSMGLYLGIGSFIFIVINGAGFFEAFFLGIGVAVGSWLLSLMLLAIIAVLS